MVASVSLRESSPTLRSAHPEPAATKQPATATIAATQNGVRASDSYRMRPTLPLIGEMTGPMIAGA